MAKPKMTKEEKKVIDFMNDNKLEFTFGSAISHANEEVAKAFIVLANSLGVKITPNVGVQKVKPQKKDKKKK